MTAPAGRAVTPEQKRAIVDAILAAWLAMPEQRLGQLLINAVPSFDSPSLVFKEDAALVLAVFDLVDPHLPPEERLTDAHRDEFKAMFANLPT